MIIIFYIENNQFKKSIIKNKSDFCFIPLFKAKIIRSVPLCSDLKGSKWMKIPLTYSKKEFSDLNIIY